jgi:hypothetical protein
MIAHIKYLFFNRFLIIISIKFFLKFLNMSISLIKKSNKFKKNEEKLYSGIYGIDMQKHMHC